MSLRKMHEHDSCIQVWFSLYSPVEALQRHVLHVGVSLDLFEIKELSARAAFFLWMVGV